MPPPAEEGDIARIGSTGDKHERSAEKGPPGHVRETVPSSCFRSRRC